MRNLSIAGVAAAAGIHKADNRAAAVADRVAEADNHRELVVDQVAVVEGNRMEPVDNRTGMGELDRVAEVAQRHLGIPASGTAHTAVLGIRYSAVL